MPPNSEIEKLERRWKENPKGTVFAPYAEVLRKHGDYPMAKEILRLGLELHPDHIPGNIVLGRCCLDLGEEGPAEAAFVHVLDLDVENVIALKALADITERQGRLMESANWLGRLIAVDPSNDEARDQLRRVDAAREAASAAMTAPIPAPALSSVSDTTDVIPVIQPPTPRSLEPASSEVASGQIGDEAGLPGDADAAIDAALGAFEASPARLPPTLPGPPRAETTEAVVIRPRPEPAPQPISDMVPGMIDLHAMAAEIETSPIADFTSDVPFEPPKTATPSPTPEVFPIGLDEPSPINLEPSGGSEFQSADDSSALLDLAPARGSEFQQANASEELRVTGTGTEYQTPSGAEELLKSVETGALLTPDPSPLEPPPPPAIPIPTSGFAAISVMATEELPTSDLGPAIEPPPVAGADAEPAVSVVDMLAAVSSTPTPPADAPPVAEPYLDMIAAVEPEPVMAVRPIEPEPEPAGGNDLHLIFPDEATEPEPPRVRRITEEVAALAEAEPSETAVEEPAPVLTETMAELYARQGHLAEALNVYRALAVKQPRDVRLAARIRELEANQAAGGRRMSYVAVDTGGESVESFFRSLTDARPAGTSAPGQEGDDSGGAPTRPASDAVSLSAIFGEEGASAAPAPTNESPTTTGGPDSFSFDQFFGGGGSSGTGVGQQQSMPSDEDLDQFQNWLKSLKR